MSRSLRAGAERPGGLILYTVTQRVLSPIARVIWRPVIEGRENVPLTGPVILASNHLTYFDTMVNPRVAPKRVRREGS